MVLPAFAEWKQQLEKPDSASSPFPFHSSLSLFFSVSFKWNNLNKLILMWMVRKYSIENAHLQRHSQLQADIESLDFYSEDDFFIPRIGLTSTYTSPLNTNIFMLLHMFSLSLEYSSLQVLPLLWRLISGIRKAILSGMILTLLYMCWSQDLRHPSITVTWIAVWVKTLYITGGRRCLYNSSV